MKNLIFAVITMLILFACSDKNPVKNDGDENIVVTDSSVTVTVTNPEEETVIEFKDNIITIPEGAVEKGTEITVSYLFSPLINWESKSEEIKIESTNLITDSITIKCPDPNVNISTMAIIKYREKNYSVQKTKKQLGSAIFTFLPVSNNSLKKSSGVKEWIVGVYSIPENLRQDRELIGEIDTNSDKKVLVLIHGFTADTEKWTTKTLTEKTFYQEMEEIYNDRILMYQYPSGMSVDKNVSELYSLLNERIFSKNSKIVIDIVGHSMGGVIGRKFAILHSDRINDLVTLGSPLNGALMDYKCVDILFFAIDPVGIVISWILSMHTQGGQDLTFHSPFMEELNTIGGFTANRYLNIIGTDGYKIWSENDGLVLTISADMTHDDFPKTREYPCELTSKKFFISHSNIPLGGSDLINTVKEFLKESENQSPSKPQLLTPENGFILYGSSITLSWTESIDPEGDEINYILNVIQPNEGEGSEMMGNSTSYFAANISWLGEYQWWVEARDSFGNKTFSDIWTFTKEKNPEYYFTNTAHINDGGYSFGVAVDLDGTIFLANGLGGLRAYTYDGSSFTNTANINDNEYFQSVAVSVDGTVFLARWYGGLRAYTYNGSSFTRTAHITGNGTGRDIAIGLDGTIFLANDFGGLRAYTYDDSSFTRTAHIDNGAYAYGVAVGLDGTVFLANDYDGLRAYTYDGTSFTNTARIDDGDFARGVAVGSDGTVFLANENDGLRAYAYDGISFTNTAHINDGGDYYYGGDVAIGSDGTIFLANGYDGLRAYTYDGTSFTNTAHIKKGGKAKDVAISSDGTIFVAHNNGGLRAYTYNRK